MSLYRRESGMYDAYIWMRGVRYRRATNTKNRRQAELIEQKFREELNLQRHGIVQIDHDVTLGQLAARFIADGCATKFHLGRLQELLPFWAEIPALGITRGHAHEYRVWRHKQKEVSDATINRDLSVLRRILYWAVENSLLLTNPLARVRFVQERRTKKHVLSVGEERKLMAACSPYFLPIVTMALDTGMRRGELLSQRLEDIDRDRALLFVTKSKTALGEQREIPLTARVLDLLKDKPRNGPLFTYRDESVGSIKTAWRKTLLRSGVPKLRFHDLRHTFNCRLMESGTIADVRKELMGHSSGQGVHALYTHVELPAKREAIRRLEEWLAYQRAELKKKEEMQAEEQTKGGEK